MNNYIDREEADAYEEEEERLIRVDERQKVLAEVEGWLVDEKKEREVEAPGYYKWEIRNYLRAELRAKLAEMKGNNGTDDSR